MHEPAVTPKNDNRGTAAAQPAPVAPDSTLRGMRPQVKIGLIVIDLLLFLIAVKLSAALGDIHSATRVQLLILAGVLFVASLTAEPKGETARTFDFSDVLRLTLGAAVGTLAALAFEMVPSPLAHASGRLVIIAALLGFIFRLAVRIGIVSTRTRLIRRRRGALPTLVVGAGKAATSLVRVISENQKLPYVVEGCVDDQALSKRVEGVRVLGKMSDLPALIARYGIECVIVAIPAAPLPFINSIVDTCAGITNENGKRVVVKVLPGASELLSDAVKISRLRDIRLEDVLSRAPVQIDLSTVAPHLENQVILVTGAGGSIGSELCRQIVALNPQLLILLGHGENSLFAIEQELRYRFGFTRTRMVLADVADMPAIRNVFSVYRPRIVFHAAAHKHVPILENNICEAVRNNVVGTHVVALAAAASGVAKFVLLSTDKAVNPTSVMGTTKRMAELVCQSFAHGSGTEFVSVRFGNVLGSRGSVLPIFQRQLESGGPLTITHRDMERFFMTIPEAVSLVLEAMSIGHDGQVFILDMGEPVKILRLAETVITLAGLTPYRDIDIVETAMRPGEKLYEETLTSSEGLSKTNHERLFIAQQERVAYQKIAHGIQILQRAVATSDWKLAVTTMREFVPSFTMGAHLSDALQPPATVAAVGPIILKRPEFSNGTNGISSKNKHVEEEIHRSKLAASPGK
ncbi:MAG: polysaccharide biosynthesis protein [Candidatus Eremiobacteraeota bacterium]|nr:polysaccharide biosynthesis protein [Candidatus Eremiobacteraeota bacterium]